MIVVVAVGEAVATVDAKVVAAVTAAAAAIAGPAAKAGPASFVSVAVCVAAPSARMKLANPRSLCPVGGTTEKFSGHRRGVRVVFRTKLARNTYFLVRPRW